MCGGGDSGAPPHPGSDAAADTSHVADGPATTPDVSGGGSDGSAGKRQLRNRQHRHWELRRQPHGGGVCLHQGRAVFRVHALRARRHARGCHRVFHVGRPRLPHRLLLTLPPASPPAVNWTNGTTTCDQCLQRWYDKDGNPRSDACAFRPSRGRARSPSSTVATTRSAPMIATAPLAVPREVQLAQVDGSTELDRCYDVVSDVQGACAQELNLSHCLPRRAVPTGASRRVPSRRRRHPSSISFAEPAVTTLDWSHADGG